MISLRDCSDEEVELREPWSLNLQHANTVSETPLPDGHASAVQSLPNIDDSIDQLNITGSVVTQVGTRIHAEVVNIIQRPKPTSTPLRQISRKTIYILIVVIALAMTVIILVCTTVLLFPRQMAAPSPTVVPTPVVHSSTPAPSNRIEIVDREKWGGSDPGGEIYTEFISVSIDNLPGSRCYTTEDCIHILFDTQNKTNNTLNYNFLIGDDGKAYEARGWHSFSDYLSPYSSSVVKIGFIGTYETQPTSVQNQTLYFIIEDGINNVYLKPNYKIIAQCCRGLRNNFGPDVKIIDFYAETFSTKCYLSHFNCRKGRSRKTTITPYTTIKPTTAVI